MFYKGFIKLKHHVNDAMNDVSPKQEQNVEIKNLQAKKTKFLGRGCI